MLFRVVRAPVLELDAGVFTEGHQVGQEKSISRFDFVFRRFRRSDILSASGMAGEWESHVDPAPVISTAAPFFRACSLALRSVAVIKEKSRIPFQRVQFRIMREDERCADE